MIFIGDIQEVLQRLPDSSIHSIVTDPPYGLKFMGRGWDHGVPGEEVWQEALRVAKPGAFLLAFGGTRTHHRVMVAIEDAGWEIRDVIMWVYGSGFPKSLDVSKAIDKMAGAEREVVGQRQDILQKQAADIRRGQRKIVDSLNAGAPDRNNGFVTVSADITAPATEAAKTWNGWGTALKPSHEEIIIAQKPVDSRTEPYIIAGNLCKLEAQLWLLSHAEIAGKSSVSNLPECDGALATAQWSVEKLINTREGLSDQMVTSQYELATNTCLNTVSLWRISWVEALNHGSMFTTGTERGGITDLKTLNCSLLALTPQNMLQAAIHQPGQWWNALPAARYFNAVSMKLSATLELFAVEGAIESGHMPRPDGIDPGVLCRPIVVARKPLDGTVAANVLKHGGGWINVYGCRGGAFQNTTSSGVDRRNAKLAELGYRPNEYQMGEKLPNSPPGRFPANLIHDGSDEVMELFPNTTSGMSHKPRGRRPGGFGNVGADKGSDTPNGPQYGDDGSAARFFYCAKASKSERGTDNHHPTVKPLALMRYLITLVTPPGGTVLDMFAGSGSTLVAAEQLGVDWIGVDNDPECEQLMLRRLGGVKQAKT